MTLKPILDFESDLVRRFGVTHFLNRSPLNAFAARAEFRESSTEGMRKDYIKRMCTPDLLTFDDLGMKKLKA